MDLKLHELSIDGTVLHYHQRGSGPPLVLIHGSMADYRNWRRQVEPFSYHARVIVYSRRYHYPNVGGGDGLDFSPFRHAADLASLIEMLAGEPAFLVGSSYGAFTALALTIQRPELVRGLVLGEPPILPWLAHLPGCAELLDQFKRDTLEPAQQSLAAGDLQTGARIFINGVLGGHIFEQLSPRARSILLDNVPALRYELTVPGALPDLPFEPVARVRVPTLVVSGAKNRALFHPICDALAATLPNSHQVIIPGASHIMHQSNPEAYNQAVLNHFLNLNR